ncbi:acyl transferase/acyl hydrolase/lysophospholipase, partial [Schizophyllum fasciatum]
RPLAVASSYKSIDQPSHTKQKIHEALQSVVIPGPGLRLLALDDGGVRGLFMLLLLQHFMNHLKQLSSLPSPPLPCDYFDVIAGSGTGGLIALLLGRLRLSVEDAIIAYTRVVQRVFAQTKADGSFKTTRFDEVLSQICGRFGDGPDTLLHSKLPSSCKTFVCVREIEGSSAGRPRRLRAYAHPEEPPLHCTVSEAVRATMGNRLFFRPVTITSENHASLTLADAGDDHCNPVFDVVDESRSLFPSRHVAYLINLGAGRAITVDASPRSFDIQARLPTTILREIQRLAEQCDRIAAAFESQPAAVDGTYHRFNLDQGVQDGKVARWEQTDSVGEPTQLYFAAIYDRARYLLSRMMHERAMIAGRSNRRGNV